MTTIAQAFGLDDDGEGPETIGQLADRLPRDGEWHYAYGMRWKRMPDEAHDQTPPELERT